MSSGFISPEFWTAKGIPILVERHVKMKILSWNLNHRILLKRIPDAVISVITDILPIPLISPPDSEGIRHAIPMDVASLIRIMSPPL